MFLKPLKPVGLFYSDGTCVVQKCEQQQGRGFYRIAKRRAGGGAPVNRQSSIVNRDRAVRLLGLPFIVS